MDLKAQRIERKAAKARYRRLFDSANQLFFEVDPIGINFEDNTDEYEAEVATVLPRLESATGEGDVRRIIREELDRWFSPEDGIDERIDVLAARLWPVWLSWKADRDHPA
jgi:PAS domain-containing protein